MSAYCNILPLFDCSIFYMVSFLYFSIKWFQFHCYSKQVLAHTLQKRYSEIKLLFSSSGILYKSSLKPKITLKVRVTDMHHLDLNTLKVLKLSSLSNTNLSLESLM